MPNNLENSSINVAVRIRPSVNNTNINSDLVSNLDNTLTIKNPNTAEEKRFIFDKIFSTNTTQKDIYNYHGLRTLSDNCPGPK